MTPEADQYRLLVPTELAEKLSETDKLQTIIDQIKEEDLESDIILQLSEESKVETSWVIIEGDKESTEETKSGEDESSTQKAADSILIIQATREGLEKALSLLAPELHLADSDPPRKGYELRLMVPNHCLSVILGEKSCIGYEAFHKSMFCKSCNRVIYKEIRVRIMMIEHTIFARSNTILSQERFSEDSARSR